MKGYDSHTSNDTSLVLYNKVFYTEALLEMHLYSCFFPYTNFV